MIEEFQIAGDQGKIRTDEADAANSGMYFFLGLFALLITRERSANRTVALDQFVKVLLRGIEAT